MPEKKGDPGGPIILIRIGAHTFNEVVCYLGASVNIMPLLYTTMCLQLAYKILCYPKGILKNILVGVEHSALRVYFVVIEIGGDDRALIILG
jgi:hypothetical protein